MYLRFNENSPNDVFGFSSFKQNENIAFSEQKVINKNCSVSLAETENLSLNELREVVLAMIQRKEELENINLNLNQAYDEEKTKNKGVLDRLIMLEKESKNYKDNYQNKLLNLENENKLLKEQLKKYVSAIQLIRSNDEINNIKEKIPAIPSPNENVHRDYSFEAEQYEKKLIQVKIYISIWIINL